MKIFNIRKGNHFSLHIPRFQYNTEELKFTAIFDPSCNYDLLDYDNLDINKLYGISWGYHMDDSFRIGWNIMDGRIHLHSYIHNKGIVKSESLTLLNFNEAITFDISFKYEIDMIVIKWNKTIEIISFKFPKIKYGYYLFPYFGGNKTAPHNMNIKLDRQ